MTDGKDNDKDKYIARVKMDNYLIAMLGIHYKDRRITELYMSSRGVFSPDPSKAALFSDSMAAFTFITSAPFTPYVQEVEIEPGKLVPEYELIPHSSFYRRVLVEYKYLPKDENGEYHREDNYCFVTGDGPIDSLGTACKRHFVNNVFPIDTGDQTHV